MTNESCLSDARWVSLEPHLPRNRRDVGVGLSTWNRRHAQPGMQCMLHDDNVTPRECREEVLMTALGVSGRLAPIFSDGRIRFSQRDHWKAPHLEPAIAVLNR